MLVQMHANGRKPCTEPQSPHRIITMNISFKDKVVIVTGATSGIGRATALAFAHAGAKLAIAGRREAEGAQVVHEIENAGGQALFVRTDVSRESDVESLVAQTVARFGALHFAFNNAGVYLDSGPITGSTEDIYRRTMDINVGGVLYSMKHQIPAILKSGGGAIVNNASALGLSVMSNASVYNASKFAVIGLTKSAAVEFSAEGVRVNAVCPAVVETEINEGMRADGASRDYMLAKHPIGRFGKVEEVASAVLFLCSPGASFTTGIAMPIDGGFTAM
jgi:NAD(P)-dependent dehydrogenase (short-subunit alcohol dehydrogenase family)